MKTSRPARVLTQMVAEGTGSKGFSCSTTQRKLDARYCGRHHVYLPGDSAEERCSIAYLVSSLHVNQVQQRFPIEIAPQVVLEHGEGTLVIVGSETGDMRAQDDIRHAPERAVLW